jgi:phytoene dehydrogenase-like protein
MAEKSIIIIGAGLAGLSAGCYAQMNGYKTQIFEMHNLPGGLCTSWKRKGYTFDGCIHYMMGSRSGTFHRFYEELGAVQGRRVVDHKELIRVEGSGGKVWTVYSDLDRLEQHLRELSPADAGLINELCTTARHLLRFEAPEKPMEWMGPLDMLKFLKHMPALRAMGKYSKISMQDYATRFKDPFLRKVFPLMMGIPGMPMFNALMLLANLHTKNFGWPVGGSLAFARAIEKRYCELGGQVQYKARVEKILVDADHGRARAIGVRLSDGTEHRADFVISAADGRSTIFDMLDGKYVNDKIHHYYDQWPIFEPFVQISLGVARDFSQEPHSLTLELTEPLKVGDQTRRWLLIRHYCYDPSMAPLGKSVVTASFLFVGYKYWKELYEDRERYKAEKQALAEAVIDRLEERFPGIKEQIEVVDVATPVTYERYTGNWRGSYMGWRVTPATTGKQMSRTLPGLDSFYMAGQWVFLGGGVQSAITSGRHVMQVVCKQDKRPFVTTVP